MTVAGYAPPRGAVLVCDLKAITNQTTTTYGNQTDFGIGNTTSQITVTVPNDAETQVVCYVGQNAIIWGVNYNE